MTTDVEGFTAIDCSFIDPTNRSGAPFLANGTGLDYDATARCEQLAELLRIDPFKRLARNETYVSESKIMSGDNE